MFKFIFSFFDKAEDKTRGWFSRRPILYGFVGGIGIVLFWRGVWHTADMVMDYLFPVVYIDATISHVGGWPWWDGPVSILMGSFILLFTGVFVSEFIHDGIVISGLKREKKLIEKTEQEIKEEDSEIKNLEDRLSEMQNSLKRIEKHLKK